LEKDVFSLAAPELSLAADAASWGFDKLFGGESKKEEPAKPVVDEPPEHRPIPGAHYFIVVGGREIVDGVTLLNDDFATDLRR
jgi:hypothetical protein